MAARSLALGSPGPSPTGTVIAVTSSEAAALADLDGHSKIRVECVLARRGTGVRRGPPPHVSDFEQLDLLIRTLGAFVRVEVG
ncbi:MAG TPA: hypothetical protein VK762_12320 [Polyangiaceae bacterium]|jgi:hypothetical protein|nr:hypothetical protein [Polyangiaceae bacterium]